MKRTIMVAAMAALTFAGVQAQTTTPQTGSNQTPQTGNRANTQNQTGNAANTQNQTGNAANYPYSGQGTYSSMDANRIPQNVRSSFGTEYSGINDAKWESNNDVYRSTFMRDGKNMSVIYDKNGKMRETRTGLQMNDLPMSVRNSLNGKEANMPYEVRVGNNTYYSATVGGKETYYDQNGKAVNMPRRK